MQFFSTPEGYVEPKNPDNLSQGYDYIYQYKDHLGNIRLSYKNVGTTSVDLEIQEENNYYPFGLEHKGYNNVVNGTEHKYKYNGKEHQEELGLDWYDFGARNYDASLGRWMNVDPLAEKAPGWTPYRYGFNNPIRYSDPDGRWEWDTTGNLVAQKGDQSYSLAKFLGTSQKNAMTFLNRSGVTANKKGVLNLKIGQKISKNDLVLNSQSNSGKVVNNTNEATDHYMNGNGESADVGNQSTSELLNSSKFQSKHKKITSQTVEPEGFFSVDLTGDTFHIGRTNVDYKVTNNGKSSSVNYTLFSRDGFWDPDFIDENTLGRLGFKKFQPDGKGPNLERFGGTPYDYNTRERTIFFKPVEEQK